MTHKFNGSCYGSLYVFGKKAVGSVFFDAKSPIRDVKRVGFILFYALHPLSLYEYF